MLLRVNSGRLGTYKFIVAVVAVVAVVVAVVAVRVVDEGDNLFCKLTLFIIHIYFIVFFVVIIIIIIFFKTTKNSQS